MKKGLKATKDTNSLPAASKLMPPAAVKLGKATPAPKKMAKPSMKKK
jgi:hypothetical protein